jgi:hypothetical protein
MHCLLNTVLYCTVVDFAALRAKKETRQQNIRAQDAPQAKHYSIVLVNNTRPSEPLEQQAMQTQTQ